MVQTTKVGTINWVGASGTTYPYDIYPISTPAPVAAGNYVWARRIPETGQYRAIYAGESENLNRRVTSAHERAACVQAQGATHVTFHVHGGGSAARLAEEADIRKKYDPHCNRQ